MVGVLRCFGESGAARYLSDPCGEDGMMAGVSREEKLERETEDRLVRLMTDYQRGRIEGFEGLYDALARDLLRQFQAASRDDHACDLVQDTFLEIHRSRHTYLAPLPVRPWVFGIARNVLRRHRRAEGRRWRREESAARELDASPEAPRRPIEAGDIDDALSVLGDARRKSWELHHVEGFSFEEISRRLGIPVGAAKLRSSRAMRALRALLGIDKGDRRG
jgi:RNA polymerase sigma-70 factor, ECF subfamily